MDVSRLRMSGLSSGLDIDGMVKKLMSANRIPLDKLKQQKQIMEWQRDDYREMNKLILDLRNTAMDMRLQSKYGAKSASTSSSAFTLTASSDATEGIFSMKVNNLAKAATATSTGDIVAGGGDANKKLSEINSGIAANSTLTISGSKGTTTITVSKDDTLDLLMRKINAQSSSTGVKASYDATLNRMFFSTTTTGISSSFSIKASDTALLDDVLKLTTTNASKVTGTKAFGSSSDKIDSSLAAEQTLRFKYDGATYDFKIDKDTTLDQLIAGINNSDAGKAGVVAYLDSSNKLAIKMPDKAKVSSPCFEDTTPDTTNILATLGLDGVNPIDVTTTASKITGTKKFEAVTDKIDSKLAAEQTLRISYDGNDYDFKINGEMSLQQLITTINASDAGKAGVSAYLDENNHLAFMVPDKTKAFALQDMTSDGTDILAKLGFDPSNLSRSDVSYEEIRATGVDASIQFNGVPGKFSSNTFTINGMTFTLKNTNAAAEDITVTHDTQGVFDSIKSFIDKYNDVIDKINGKLLEERYRDFAPLTDVQKEEMKDTDIENWEKKAKSGLIRRDQTLESALNQFRTAFYSVVTGIPSGDLAQLSQIGISTMEYSERGKLHIDEDKLKKALSDNPDQVMKLFTADDNNKDSRSGDGVANRIYQIADSFNKQLIEKAGSASTTVLDSYTIGKNLKDMNKRIDTLAQRLSDMEERYYKQFSAMESALNNMNAQSAYLAQQFGGA